MDDDKNYLHPSIPAKWYEQPLAHSLADSAKDSDRAEAAKYAWRTRDVNLIERLINDPALSVKLSAYKYAAHMGLYERLVEIGTATYKGNKEQGDELKLHALLALVDHAIDGYSSAKIVADHLAKHGSWQTETHVKRLQELLPCSNNGGVK